MYEEPQTLAQMKVAPNDSNNVMLMVLGFVVILLIAAVWFLVSKMQQMQRKQQRLEQTIGATVDGPGPRPNLSSVKPDDSQDFEIQDPVANRTVVKPANIGMTMKHCDQDANDVNY